MSERMTDEQLDKIEQYANGRSVPMFAKCGLLDLVAEVRRLSAALEIAHAALVAEREECAAVCDRAVASIDQREELTGEVSRAADIERLTARGLATEIRARGAK